MLLLFSVSMLFMFISPMLLQIFNSRGTIILPCVKEPVTNSQYGHDGKNDDCIV